MSDSSHAFPLDPPEQAPTPPEQSPNRRNVERGIGLAILGATALVLALIGIDVAVIGATQRPAPRPVITRQVVKVSGSAQIAGTIFMSVSPEMKPGPDGKLHDAFSVTRFNVHAGRAVKLVIDNTDSAVHSITSPSAGVNIVVKPGTHTYILSVSKTGVFQWYCNYPCDPYSMMHDGYMRGTITSI